MNCYAAGHGLYNQNSHASHIAMRDYIKAFSRLRTDKNQKVWAALTNHQAPHKPLLLLSLMDHFAQGLITANLIEPSYELVETFNTYWAKLQIGRSGNMAYPFPRLKTDGFWHLVPNHGYENKIQIKRFDSMVRLREYCLGARLDEELFLLMMDMESREALRGVILQTYFAPEIRPVLLEQGAVNYAAYKYSLGLLRLQDRERAYMAVEAPVRDQGFRRAIVRIYDHRCTICGIRMLTPTGHTIVDASHIKPWSESHDDKPTNGLCLCKLCHWSFDEGIIGISDGYKVLVAKSARKDTNLPGHILTFQDRPILLPEEETFKPAYENIEWHREKVFSS